MRFLIVSYVYGYIAVRRLVMGRAVAVNIGDVAIVIIGLIAIKNAAAVQRLHLIFLVKSGIGGYVISQCH